ncbi:MAG: ATP-binding protein [Candidatus Binatia bacterium]
MDSKALADLSSAPVPPLRLLLVEDSALDAELEIAALESAGFACQWERVETAAELTKRLCGVPLDLILADYNLPRFDGISALRLVRQQFPYLPFILVSGTVGEETAIEALKSGATDYVLKRNLARLAPVVRRALREREEQQQRWEAEAALRRSEERYRIVVEATHDAVWELDPRTDVMWWNEGMTRLFGYAPDEVGSRKTWWYARVHPEDRARVGAIERAVIAGEREHFAVEYRYQRADGTYAEVLDRGSVLRDERGRPVRVTGALIDISDHMRAEREIRLLNADLERRVAERTAELERVNKELQAFSYSVSHDLRAPLRAIDGFTEIVLQDYGSQLPRDVVGYLDRINASAKRMAQLIEDLLSLSRVSSTELVRRPVDLTALATTILGALCEREPGRAVEAHIADGLLAHGDEQLLRIALENLLDNAWKFTSREPSPRIEVGIATHEGSRVYFVRDNGAGFDMAYASNLFGAFRRLHTTAEFPGTGIGLATVERVIHRHGGRIWADAAVGRGATFLFTLPMA